MPTGSCHCGATRFTLAEAPREMTSCNCSLCHKRGALWSYYDPEDVTFTSQDDAIYTWQSDTVSHHFCPHCGCGTYSVSPHWVDGKPDRNRWRYGVNVRLLDDFDIDSLPVVQVDGRSGNWYSAAEGEGSP
jgi:hypothetical protein